MPRASRRSFLALGLLAAALGAPACRSGGAAVSSSDPKAPVYHSPTAEFARVKGIALHFVSVTTNNNEGVDLVRSVFAESLTAQLGKRFGPVTEGTAAPAGGALLDVSLRVNWGSRAARAMVGYGAGRAGIEIQYDLKDGAGNLLARLHTTDTMSGGYFGGDAKQLVFAAASKWNTWFEQNVLVDAPKAGS